MAKKEKDYTGEIVIFAGIGLYLLYVMYSNGGTLTSNAQNVGLKIDTEIASDLVLAGTDLSPGSQIAIRRMIRSFAQKLQPTFGYEMGSI